MKKVYEAPAVEKVEFQYRDQVVVASGVCTVKYVLNEMDQCSEVNGQDKEYTSNIAVQG